MSNYDSVFSAASQLPIGERLRLIDDLASTVPDNEAPSLSPEWLAEIERRSNELKSGAVTPVPWTEVREQLFRQVGIERED